MNRSKNFNNLQLELVLVDEPLMEIRSIKTTYIKLMTLASKFFELLCTTENL